MTKNEVLALKPESADALKEFATLSGLQFHPNIGFEKLKERVLDTFDDEGDAPDAPVIQDEPENAPVEAEKVVEPVAPELPAPVHVAIQKVAEPVAAAFPTQDEFRAALAGYISQGLQIVELSDEYYHIRVHNRETAGNMKQPLSTIVSQARLLFRATKVPTEE